MDQFRLLDVVCDPDCWEKRALAVGPIRLCQESQDKAARVVAEARALPADNGHGTGGTFHIPQNDLIQSRRKAR